jgi:hypothetical protein
MNERMIFDRIFSELTNGLGGKAPKSYVLRRIAVYVDGFEAEKVLASFVEKRWLQEENTEYGLVIRVPQYLLYHDEEVKIKHPRIKIIISFADGEKRETEIDAAEGAFNFRVQPDCPAVTNVWIAAPGSNVEPYEE